VRSAPDQISAVLGLRPSETDRQWLPAVCLSQTEFRTRYLELVSQPSSSTSPEIVLIRHGETEWSRTGRHTGRTDIALTAAGVLGAQAIGRYLTGHAFERVLVSPLTRAQETCRLAGFGQQAQTDADLVEWDYGIYEGRTTLDIRRQSPGWSVWKSPITGGESLEQVAARAQRVVDKAPAAIGDIAIFAHGHVLRVLAACWIGLPPLAGRTLALDTASVSVLGFERQTRVIRKWNLDVLH
jgi:broad specificity phosphatase PhoE